MPIRYLSLLFLITLFGCKSAEERQAAREAKAAEKAAAREEKRLAKEAEHAQRIAEADAKLQASLPPESPFRQVHVGMSEGEVEAALGAPTSKDSTLTGREFVPFNIGGRGSVQTIWFYKGKGRVVFLGATGGVQNRVLDAADDPSEIGYKVTQRPEAK
ncbi:MAG: hypothetical protein IPK26_04015 [Planctomycetes bacterium]|nr:hypothetical protein [Planctomycetota bacterium]